MSIAADVGLCTLHLEILVSMLAFACTAGIVREDHANNEAEKLNHTPIAAP